MTNQPSLPFVAGSTTSAEAATMMRPHAPIQREVVFDAIRMFGPLTDQEIARLTHLSENSVRPRRVELAREGRIIEAGTRQLVSGRLAVLWTTL